MIHPVKYALGGRRRHACRAARSVVSAPREWPISAMTNAQNGWVGVTMIPPARTRGCRLGPYRKPWLTQPKKLAAREASSGILGPTGRGLGG